MKKKILLKIFLAGALFFIATEAHNVHAATIEENRKAYYDQCITRYGAATLETTMSCSQMATTQFPAAAAPARTRAELIAETNRQIQRCITVDGLPEIFCNTLFGTVAGATQGARDMNAAAEECGASSGSVTETGTCIAGKAAKAILGSLITWEDLWWLASFVPWVLYLVARFMVGIAAFMLDVSVYFMVVKMGHFLAENTGGQGLRAAWELIRDLGNIAIIAGFIAVAFTTILGIGQFAANKYLSKLIIAALLINFSYFITGAVIDASNFVAASVYSSNIMTSSCLEQSETFTAIGPRFGQALGINPAAETAALCSISESFMAMMRIDTWDGIESLVSQGESSAANENTYFKLFVLSFMAAIFLFTAAWAFFIAAFLLIGRFVTLIILVVLSPLGVIGGQVPFLGDVGTQWWKQLWSQALLAPAFMILIALSMKILNGLSKYLYSAENINFSQLPSSSLEIAVQVVPVMILFVICIGFLYASVSTARNFSKGETSFKLDLTKIYDLVDTIGAPVGRNTIGIPGRFRDWMRNPREDDSLSTRATKFASRWTVGWLPLSLTKPPGDTYAPSGKPRESEQDKFYKNFRNIIGGPKAAEPEPPKPTRVPPAPAAPATGVAGGTTTASARSTGFWGNQIKKIPGLGGKPPAVLSNTGVPTDAQGQQQQTDRLARAGLTQMGVPVKTAAPTPTAASTPTPPGTATTGLPVNGAQNAGTPEELARAIGRQLGTNGQQDAALKSALDKLGRAGGASASAIDKQSLQLVDIATRVGGLAGIEKEEIEEMRRQHEYERRIGRKEYSDTKDKEAAAKEHEKASAGVESIENTVLSRMDRKIGELTTRIGTSGGGSSSEAIQMQSERARLVAERQSFVAARDERRTESRAIVQTLRQEETSQSTPPPTPSGGRSGGVPPVGPSQSGAQRQPPAGAGPGDNRSGVPPKI
ncbi:MAG: hypothetical protein AAB573_05320 [Patescibacteria group bacterium]